MNDVVVLFWAGAGAGLVGSSVGLASLVSYPALLAVGLDPLAANVTNTVSLVFSSVGSTLGSRTELVGQGQRLRALAVASLGGGLVGGALLLLTPPAAFGYVVPWLIALASLAVLIQRQPAVGSQAHDRRTGRGLVAGTFAVSIYGGYFGAAAGVMLLALLQAFVPDTLARTVAVKNVVLGLANGVAAITFAVLGPVRWSAVLPLAAGFLIGGRLGPIVVRHAPPLAFRWVVGLAGLALAARLGAEAYR